VAEIVQAAERGDVRAVHRLAHTLKSEAGWLGARELAALCAEIEVRSRDGQQDGTAPLIAALPPELERAQTALQAALRDWTPV
jgi:HPt (histidine-containing phosphotransfer) domain-containing protein